MARKRKPKGPSQVAQSLPNAAEFLGRLVSHLGLPDAKDADVLRERNHQRFLSGETKPTDVAERVLGAVASTLSAHGYVLTEAWPRDLGFPTPAMLLGWAVRDLRTRWDDACIRLRSGFLRASGLCPVLLTAARLLTIDLALRAGAWMILIDHRHVARDRPPERPTTERVMTDVIDETGLSAPELAKKLGIERTAIDAWRKGARPGDANLGVIASFLAKNRSTGTAEQVQKTLRRSLAIADVLRALEGIPWFADQVDDLWCAFWKFSAGVARRFIAWGSDFEEDIRPRILTGLIMYGTNHPAALPLIHDLRREASGDWQADLDAGPAWDDRLCFAASVGNTLDEQRIPTDLPEAVRELMSDPKLREAAARHVLSGPIVELAPPGHRDDRQMLVIKNPPKVAAENQRLQASLAMSRGRLGEAIVHLRRAVELVPDHDAAHFELGAAYWQAGYIEEGISECRIAAALRPDWELPQVEIGIILLNVQRHEEARVHLEAVYAAAKAPTVHLKFNLGTARWKCGAFAEGLALLEEVLSDERSASYPYALDQAAHCAFMTGDSVRGRAYAKRARDLGRSETHDRWSTGAYRKTGGR